MAMAEAAPVRRYRITLPELHPGQAEVADSPARYRVIMCGRSWGKSLLALMLALEELQRPGAVVWYLGPSYPDVRTQWYDLLDILPPGFPGEINRTEMTLTVENGARLLFKSAHVGERKLRGGQRDLVVVDEAASIPDGEDIWQKALRPALTQRQGRAVFIGTPRGMNWFTTLYYHAQEDSEGEWQAWHLPTESNPHVPPDEIEAAQAELPDRVYRQEYLAEIIADGTVIPNVAACIGDVSAFGTGRVVFGVDWGKREDYTVIMGYDCDSNVARVLARMNIIDYVAQTARLKALAAQWSPMAIVVERNSMGEPLIDALQRDGLAVQGFFTTAVSKPPLIDALTLAFQQQEITIEDDPALTAELRAFTMERLPSGNFRYAAPSGMHDDCVMALALAWYARRSAAPIAQWVEL